MEETLDPIKRKYKYAADYALILGGYIAFFFVLDYLFPGNGVVTFLNIAGFFATPVLCYQLAKTYRDKALGGYINFGQVWTFGILLFFFAALIMSVLYYVYYQFLKPDALAQIYNLLLQTMEQTPNYPKEGINWLINLGEFTPIQAVLMNLVGYIIGGAVLFLIISPMVSRKKDDLPPTDYHYKPYQDNKDSDQEPKA